MHIIKCVCVIEPVHVKGPSKTNVRTSVLCHSVSCIIIQFLWMHNEINMEVSVGAQYNFIALE
jgi:hypothetical protein